MSCRDFSSLYSAQMDGRAGEAEQTALRQHLGECLTCRRRATEMRSLRADLQSLTPPRSRRTLPGEIQIALRQEAATRAGAARRRADLFDLWRMRAFSQGVGAVVSMCLFLFVITGVFRPAYRTLALALAASELIFEDPTIRLKLPPPLFEPDGDLLRVGASLSENEEIVAMVKVRKDGRASVDQIVTPLNDPAMMTKFSNVITQKASFQPTRPDQNIRPEAVVIMIAMRVPGRASI
ncbi:MAG: anti-sigma factor family protein [Blastocatellia bacterium]